MAYSIIAQATVDFRVNLFTNVEKIVDKELILCLEDSKLYYVMGVNVYEIGVGLITS